MRKSSFFRFPAMIALGLLLTACGTVSANNPGSQAVLAPGSLETRDTFPAPSPSQGELFIETGTATPMLELTPVPTGTPDPSATATASDSPTPTEPSYPYVFPLQPPALASFAEGLASHGYPATDIFAPEGTRFVAVTNGVVDFVSYKDTWDPQTDDPATRGGLSVAIIGDDGVRYYGSHLSKIQDGIHPGLRVVIGQLLGFVGHTGDARNREAHLHFGISRPSFPEDWKARRGQVDPYAYLFAWHSGLNLTPGLPSP